MKDTVIKGDGTSRKIKGPSTMPTTFEEWRSQVIAGTASLDISINEAGLDVVGTSLSKENLLSDSTKSTIGLTQSDPTVNNALQKLGEGVNGAATLTRTALWTGAATSATTLTLSDNISNYKRLQLLTTTNQYNNYVVFTEGSQTSTYVSNGWLIPSSYAQAAMFLDGTYGSIKFPADNQVELVSGFDSSHKLLGIWGVK